jgi:glutamate--cysteine ligase
MTCETSPIIETKAALVEFLQSGCKPIEQWRLGSEQEAFAYCRQDASPLSYEGEQPSILELLQAFADQGWEPVTEAGSLVGLTRGATSISLEPGGQFEFAGAPNSNAHQIFGETQAYLRELKTLADQLGIIFVAMGHRPEPSKSPLPWMPKDRYRIMRAYMPTRGSRGHDMMQSTCACQVTLDFSSEADMVKKIRVALAVQPLVTAMFANSPWVAGKPNGFVSNRGRVWQDTDPDRCGDLPFVFEAGMGFERYVDYILDVPMYFVYRDGKYIDASGLSFRDFLSGRLSVLPGELPTLDDWAHHLTTVFPQVRMKQFLEMRGADAGRPAERIPALAALWCGLLYDSQSLDAAWDRVAEWTADERADLHQNVSRFGWHLEFRRQPVIDLCRWLVGIAEQGLKRRSILNAEGIDESIYLQPLWLGLESGEMPAEQLLRRFSDNWPSDPRQWADVAQRIELIDRLSRETFE